MDEEISASTAKQILGLKSERSIYDYAAQGLLTERVAWQGMRRRRWYRRAEVEALKRMRDRARGEVA